MAPRKRQKASAASTPHAETQPKTPQETSAIQSQNLASPQDENLLNDPWSDDQETQLFKSMMKWKPTGEVHSALHPQTANLMYNRPTQTLQDYLHT